MKRGAFDTTAARDDDTNADATKEYDIGLRRNAKLMPPRCQASLARTIVNTGLGAIYRLLPRES